MTAPALLLPALEIRAVDSHISSEACFRWCMAEEFCLSISQTPSLLIEAMRRRVHRRRSRTRLARLDFRGERGAVRDGDGIPPPSTQNTHNNYLAPPQTRRRAKSKGTGKVGMPGVAKAKPGAPFGNRNAVNPALAELRAVKAMVKAHIARMKAAIAAAEAIMAARPRRKRRRINCFIYETDGVVMRVCARVRIAPRRQDAKEAGLAPPSGPQTRPELGKFPANPALRRGLSRRIPGAPAGLAQLVEHLICNQGKQGNGQLQAITQDHTEVPIFPLITLIYEITRLQEVTRIDALSCRPDVGPAGARSA